MKKAPLHKPNLKEIDKMLNDLYHEKHLINDILDEQIRKLKNKPKFSLNATSLDTLLKNIKNSNKLVNENIETHNQQTQVLKLIFKYQQMKNRILTATKLKRHQRN